MVKGWKLTAQYGEQGKKTDMLSLEHLCSTQHLFNYQLYNCVVNGLKKKSAVNGVIIVSTLLLRLKKLVALTSSVLPNLSLPISNIFVKLNGSSETSDKKIACSTFKIPNNTSIV